MKGIVKTFNKQKGYGFIQGKEENSYFFHYSELQMKGFKTVDEGQKVEFDVKETERGMNAINIKLV
jgi:CspA family cold shock protein